MSSDAPRRSRWRILIGVGLAGSFSASRAASPSSSSPRAGRRVQPGRRVPAPSRPRPPPPSPTRARPRPTTSSGRSTATPRTAARYLPASDQLRPPYHRVWVADAAASCSSSRPCSAAAGCYLLKNNGGAVRASTSARASVRWKRKVGYLAASSPALRARAVSTSSMLERGKTIQGRSRRCATRQAAARRSGAACCPAAAESSPRARRRPPVLRLGERDRLRARQSRRRGALDVQGRGRGQGRRSRSPTASSTSATTPAASTRSGRRNGTQGLDDRHQGRALRPLRGQLLLDARRRLRPRLHRQHRRQRLLVLLGQRQARLDARGPAASSTPRPPSAHVPGGKPTVYAGSYDGTLLRARRARRPRALVATAPAAGSPAARPSSATSSTSPTSATSARSASARARGARSSSSAAGRFTPWSPTGRRSSSSATRRCTRCGRCPPRSAQEASRRQDADQGQDAAQGQADARLDRTRHPRELPQPRRRTSRRRGRSVRSFRACVPRERAARTRAACRRRAKTAHTREVRAPALAAALRRPQSLARASVSAHGDTGAPRSSSLTAATEQLAVVEDRRGEHRVGARLDALDQVLRLADPARGDHRHVDRAPTRRARARGRSRPWCRRGPSRSAGSPPPRARRPRAPTRRASRPVGVRPPATYDLPAVAAALGVDREHDALGAEHAAPSPRSARAARPRRELTATLSAPASSTACASRDRRARRRRS